MMAEGDRADPLGDISDFAPVTKAPVRPKPPIAVVREISVANGFTSRAPIAGTALARPAQRRHRTGRNTQLNLKVTPETLTRFAAIADREGWLLAETLEHALDALEMAIGRRR